MKKEMIKAIRLVYGLNPDLRVNLNGINRARLFDWIAENRLGIFGSNFFAVEPSPTSGEWMKYERAMRAAVNQVISGRGD